MNPKLLRPKSVGEYVNGINDVVASFMERLRYLKDVQGDGQFVPHLPNELNKFTMESKYMPLTTPLFLYVLNLFIRVN